jgi:hypothetical protein
MDLKEFTIITRKSYKIRSLDLLMASIAFLVTDPFSGNLNSSPHLTNPRSKTSATILFRNIFNARCRLGRSKSSLLCGTANSLGGFS